MKRKGTIAIPKKGFEGKYTVCSYEVTCFDQPDPRGLDGGRIDYMLITKKGEVIAEHRVEVHRDLLGRLQHADCLIQLSCIRLCDGQLP